MAEYQRVVAGNVQDIATQYYPHRRGCVGHGIGCLLRAVEYSHRHERKQYYQIIFPYQRQELFRLSEAVEKEIERGHHCGERERKHPVGLQSCAQGLPHPLLVFATEERTHNGRDAGSESYLHHYRNEEDGIDKRRSRQLVDTVCAHHRRVGKRHKYHPDLGSHYGKSQTDKRLIFLSVSHIPVCILYLLTCLFP